MDYFYFFYPSSSQFSSSWYLHLFFISVTISFLFILCFFFVFFSPLLSLPSVLLTNFYKIYFFHSLSRSYIFSFLLVVIIIIILEFIEFKIHISNLLIYMINFNHIPIYLVIVKCFNYILFLCDSNYHCYCYFV